MEIKKMPKNAEKFLCEYCDFKCSKKSNYEKHLLSAKHLRKQNGNNVEMIVNKKIVKNFECHICKKNYNTNSGLWKHLKLCKVSEPEPEPEPKPEPEPEINNESTTDVQLKTLTTLVIDLMIIKKISKMVIINKNM